MMNEGDPPPAQEPTDAQPAAPEPAKSEGSASFLRAARAGDLEKVLELLRAGTDINTSNANGLNSLHLASKEGHSEVVRELIKRQAQVDAATRKGNTALHIASLAGQSLIVTILVENGANVNVQSVNGFTPLYMAAQENHEDVVRYLLNHGANQALSTEDGFTPLAVALQQGHDRVVAVLLENDAKGKVRLPALHIAAKKDDTKAATLLLQNEHNPDVTSKSGFTPLHIAAHYGHENVGQLLLDKGANVNYQARHNISPLHVATKWGRINMANVLLARGAIIDSRTKDLLTPLHCAARSGHDQVVDLLVVQGAPISAKTKNGLAPLHMAAQGDHVDAARTLLYHRAPVDDVTVDYLTPLHVAAHCGHVRVAKLLLDRSADPNSRALNGFTPLHIACKKNRIKVVELLLKYRAAIEATTESGLTPLHVAAFMGAINIVIYLLQQGANPDVETVRGETPLHLAARANQTDVVRVLIRNGAKVDAQARELQTPLHIASRLGNTDIVVLLLQAGANSNATTRDNYSPLHIAAKEGQEEVAGILLDHNADKSLLTKKGFTPLHLASKYGNLEVVRFLLERGTPVDIEGKNQVTPLHVAAHYNNDKVAMLLLENGASAKAAAKNGYTPLHIAAKKNQMEIASTLLQFKADPNAKSRAGFTPLHLAAQEGHKEISGLLIENGSDVGAKANNGLTAMHLCAQEDHVPVAQILHDSGAEINSKTNAGYTPLHVACHFGQLNMVKFLVEHGADVGEKTRASYTPLHQAAQQGHNNCVRYLLENGASPNEQTATGQTPLSIAQRLGYVSVVETLRTVTETTVITETTTVDERYKPQNPEAMNETMFSESEDEGQAAEHEVAAAHAKDFSDHLTQALQDSTGVHMIHTGEQLLQRSQELENGGAIPKVNSGGMSPEKEYAKIAPVATSSPIAQSHSQPLGIAPRAGSISGQFQQQPLHGAGPEDNLEELVRRAQNHPIHTGNYDNSGAAMLENGHADNVPIGHHVTQPSFLISFLVDARGGAMRGCRHSGVRIIVPPRKASQPIRVTCRYLRKDKLAHPPPLSEGEELASRILEMAPAGAKFLGPVILEVPHFASLRDREREIVILRSDDGQHWKEHQLEATEDAVQEVLNESFDAEDLAQLDDLQTPRITRILTSDFPMYFAVVTRVRQEVHCVGPEGGVIISSVVPRVQAIFPDGSLTKTIKVSVQAQPVPQEMVTRLHGNRVAVSPIVTVEPRRRKFHKPITLCIPLPQSNNKGMLTQYSGQQGQEPPTLRLLCSITGGSAPAQWEDITGTTQLTFTGDEVSFTTTVSARFWLMDCQTPRDAARMAQEVYNEAISIPYMAKFAVFARRTFPVEGQLRVFCMTDDKEDKTLEKQEHFKLIAKSRDVEVLKGKHQFLEFSGNLVPITKSGDQLSLFFLPFQENRLAFMVKTRSKDDNEAATEGRIGFMTEPKIRSDALPPQQPICTLAITLPEYTGEVKPTPPPKKDATPFEQKYGSALEKELPEFVHQNVLKGIGADWPRLGRALEVPHRDIQHIRHNYPGQECKNTLKIWIHLKKEDANQENLDTALRKIGRDDIVRSIAYGEPEALINYSQADSPSQKRDPIRHFEEVPTATLVKREVRTEDLVTRESIQPTHHVEHTSAIVQEPSYSAPVHHSPVPEEPELEEEPVAELRTVVRTERHVHDTDNGPEVEEKTITTTYEDDVAINESITVRTVPLTDAEWKKWEDLNRAADDHQPSPAQRSTVAESTSEQIPDDVEQTVESESHREDDGTIVTTTVTTSHISESPLASPTTRSEEPEDHDEAIHHVSSASQFQVESWDGEHAEHDHHEHEEPRRFSIYLEEGGAEKSGVNQDDDDVLEDEPIASSGQFERTRSASLAAALLELDPRGVPLVQFFKLATNEPLLEVDEGDDEIAPSEAELVLSQLLFTLRSLKMSGGDAKHSEAVQRLRELEEELRAAGAVTPADPAVSEAVARALAVAGAGRDVQIRVNQSKHTTTTKTVYETETSAMAHMDVDQIRKLQQDIIADISAGAEQHSGQDSGTTQKKETAEEGFTNEDGSVVVSKKMTRVVTTTRTTLPGEGEEPSAPDSPVESLGSVKDRIAKFEQFKTLPIDPSVSGPPPSVHALPDDNEEADEQAPVPAVREHHYQQRESPEQPKESHSVHERQEYREESPASQQFHAASSQHHQQPESGEESDGEGLGSKVLDFAKKAGMVAGGVVAAPVALAAVGAKAAYDALKKDSDDEGEGQEQKSHEYESREHHEESYSPAQSSHAESDHRQVPESPAVSEKEHPHVVETTTTTTTITREFYDEPEHAQTHEEATSEGRDSGRSGQTEQSIPEVHFTESDTEVEKHGDEHHEDSFLEPTVGIVITPHTPIPPEHPDDIEEVEDEQPQEPLELSEPEHVARAEIKDTREYSDEELAHELSPSEEHVSTAEIKDIKSYSPTSSDDERKGKVSPPLPQVRHVISPSVASEVSSHDDELAAHFVAESFEKHDEGRVETIEQTPIYRGHHSPGQTSPIVSEHPIAQEYAESVTSHDEGDNISLKSGHEPEIARHSVASVHEEEEEEKSGLGDYAKKAGMIVGGVIAAPVALAAVGAKAAYDALKGDSDDEDQKPEGHEEQEVITTQTTIMESPIEHEDIPPPHLEDVTPKVSHHEHPHEVITETTTTTTREYYDEPSESPVPSEKEPEHHMVSEKTTTTTVTREFYDEPEEPVDESYSPAPSSHVDSERRIAESPVASEKEYPAGVVETTTTTTYVTRQHDDEPETEVRRSPSPAESQEHLVKETTTTTTVTREYEDEDHESESPESVREAPHVTETTTTTTLIREYEHPEEGFDSERLSEPAQSPEPTESEKSVLHVTETTTTTTVTRDFYEDPEHHDASPVHFDEHYEQRESGSPIPSERSTRSVPQAESPIGERHSPVPSEPVSEKDAHHVTETITTTTVTREFYDEPEQEQDRHLPAPSSQVESEHPIAESPAISEKDLPHVVETTTTTTVTREYEQEPEVETTAQSAYDFKDDEYPRPESPAEVYPIPSEERHESEHHMVSETTTTTTVTREFYDDPEEHPEESHSPAPSSHAESDRRAESPVESEKEHPHVVETTTTTTVTREFHDDDQFDRESTVAYDAPSSELEHRALESPEQPHVTETTTTTTVTREFYDDDYERPESQPSQAEHKAPESPAITERHEFHQESPAAHQFYTESASSQQHQQPESADESDGEGFGSKVLGFAKKAGMVAGGVVAAPVALAAVGAKAAYDALKKDSDDEGEGQEQKSPVYETREYQEESFSPASSSHAESEHRPVPESPAVSEKELPHTAEPTTESHEIEQDEPSDLTKDSPLPSERDQEHHIVTETTTVVTREYFDEPEHLQEYPEDTRSPAPSSHADSERHQTESPVESEKEHPHHVETTTTTTVTREYEGEPEQSEQSYEAYEQRGSPSPTGSQEHLVKETTTTTTVTREFYDEPEHAQGDPEESHSPAPSSHVESERRAGSPVESEKDHPHHVVETITTTTVSREFHDDDHEAAPFDIERDVPFSEVEHSRDLESPEHHHVTETTTTTTVTRDFYEDEEPYRQESPIAQEFDRAASPTKSVEGSEPHIVETTTTTTVTREYDQPEERFDSERLSEPAQSPEPTESEKSVPHVTETTTTTTVTRDFYEEPEHRDASPVHLYEHHEQRESGSPIPSEQSVRSVPQADSPVGERHSPVPSEPMSEKEAHHITETTTTTTVTREYFDQVEPEHREASPVLAEQQFEQRESPRGSPVPSEKSNQEDIHVVKETTTTTTVTREFYDEPEQTRDHPEESYSPAPSSHADSEHRQVPESPVVSEKQLTSEAHLTQDSPAAQYFHEQTGHQTESPIPTEQAPLLTQQQQPESGEESDGEGFGSKVLGFAKKAGMVAGGVVAAPVALAAVGAKAAYDALKRDSDGEDEGEQEALLGDVREQRSVESPSRAGDYQQFEEPEHKFDESPVSSEKHHVTETTTTTTTTREYFDEPESPAPSQEGHESEIGSQKSIPHVVETTTTTTVKRDYDEEPTSESPVPSEKETTTSTREVFETAAGDEPEHHYIETTTTTVQKEVFDEPQEAEDDGEPKAEIPHVVETTTTTKTTREYDDEEEGSESGSGAPHVTETTTTTTITREFYGDQPDEQLEEEPVAAQIDDQDVSPDSESVTSVSREIHADEPHVVETTTTTTVTREYHDEPEESEDSDVKETTTTTTTTREYFAEEPESPVAKEHSEEDRESPVQHVTETTTTTTLSRDAHEEEDPRFEHLEHREESPIDHGHEDLLRSESPVERSDPHVMETTTTTIVTREYEQPDGGFDSERLSEPAQSPEPIGTPAESEKSIPHVVETTTTTTVTREFLDDEEPEHREASPVHSEQQFQQRESPVSPRGSPIPSEHDDSHLVKETTTTTTVTREIYDEPEHPSGQSPVPSEREQEHHMVTETTTTTTVTREYEEEPEHIHEQESYSPAPSSHAESEHRPVPESPAVSEKQFTTETTLTQDSPAAQYFHEQPEQQTVSPIPTEQAPLLSQQQQPESGEESDGEGFGSKVLGFAKKAGMVAGGVVAAPVALAAVGAKAAYDALKRDSDGEDEGEQEALLGDVREQRSAGSPSAEYQRFEDPEQRFQESPEPSVGAHSHEFQPESTTKSQPAQEEDQESLKSPTESEQSFRNVVETTTTTTTTTYEKFEDDSAPASPTQSHKEELKQFQDEQSPESSGKENDEKEAEARPELERQGSYSPGYSPKSPTGSLAESETEAHPVVEVAEDHAEPEIKTAGSPVPSEEGSTKFVETTTTTTVTREYQEPEDQFEHRSESQEYQTGSPVPSEQDSSRVIETTTTTTVTREHFEAEDEPSHVVESQQYSPSGSPVPSEKSTGHGIETTTTTTVTKEYDHPEEVFDYERLSEPAQSPVVEHDDHFAPTQTQGEQPCSPVPSEEDVHGYVQTTTTTTTVTREYQEPEDHFEHPSDSQTYQAGTPIPSETESARFVDTTSTVTRDQESPVQQQFEDYQHQYSEEPAIAPYQQPTEYGRVDSHDVPASPAPSVESPVSHGLTEHGFDSERLSEPSKTPEVHEEFQQKTTITHEDSPASQYFHEQPERHTDSPPTEQAPLLSQQQQPESGEESDGEGFGSKVLGFAKKAGMVAGGVVAAPVALAAVGAKAAYDALKRDSDGDDEGEQEALLGDVREQRTAGSPPTQYQQFEEPGYRFEEPSVQPVEPTSDDESPASDVEPEHLSRKVSESEQSHHYTETIRKTTVTREYLDDDEPQQQETHFESQDPVLKSPSEQVVETTTTVIRHYHDEPKEEEESEEKTLPEEVTVLREVYEAPAGDEPEHHYIETKTTTIITKEVHEPEEYDVPSSPIESEKDLPIRDRQFEEPHSGDTSITTVTRDVYQEPEGVRPPSGSEADDESHAPRYLETTTTTTVTREYEVSEDEEDGRHPDAEHRQGSPVPSEDSVTHVVEKTTTTTVTEERYEPEESHALSDDHDDDYVKTTTTTTTVTHEHFDEPEHVVESQEYQSGSPIPSEQESSRVIETTTTTVTREHYEPEDEPSHIIESQQYSPSGSPVPSEKSTGHVVETTTTTTVIQERYEPEQEYEHPAESHSPVPSEEDVHGFVKTTTTTTTVTREHFEPEDEPTHVVASEEYQAGSPVPSEEESSKIIETTTTTTVMSERLEHDDEPSHIVESQQYSPSGSPVPSEKSAGQVSHELYEPEQPHFTEAQLTQDSPAAQYFHEQPEHQTESPIPTKQAPLLSQQQQPESGEESEGEGFGSKFLGFAKKAGMVAGGVVAAPVALAAVGAKAAYDALKRDSDGEDEEEQEALLGDVRERRAVDSETQEPGATFYEPEEEDKISGASPKEPEPKIVFPVDTPADKYVQDKQAFESAVQAEGPYVIESEDYEPAVHQEQRISSPVHSDSGDVQTTPQQEPEEEETPRVAEHSEADAPYVIDSEEYEFSNREEQRISSPADSDDEERYDAEPESYVPEQQNNDEEDPTIVESEEYTGSGQGSPRPFEESTTTTVISVHHEPAAIPEPEVDEEELEQDRSIIESGEYTSGSPIPAISVSNVEHVHPHDEHKYTPELLPTAVDTAASDHSEASQDPYIVDSEEYVRSSPIGHERPESPSGSPIQHQDEVDDSHVIESQEYTGSPVPSEESVQHVVEKITTTTTTEEHFEPEDSADDVQEYVKTTTTTTTVTQEHFEPEEEEKHVVESEEYKSGSPVPSEPESARVIETTTTTTVTREHIEPEDEPTHIVESQQYSPSGSPVPSEKSTGQVIETKITTTVTREHVESEDEPEHTTESQEHSAPGSPVPSEKSVDRVIETTTTTTVTREHVEHEDDFGPVHTEAEPADSHSPVPSEEDVHGFIKTTTTTTTVTREHFEPEDQLSGEHTADSHGSPIPSEPESGRIETRDHFEPEQEPSHIVESQQYSSSGSPVPSEKSIEHVIESGATSVQTHQRFEPEEERRTSTAPSEGSVHESIQTTSAMTSGSHFEPEHYQKEEGEESDGEGFGSKVLGFAKKAGMVAGGVVAAPVALAAVGAKAAYDALKKDSDDEGEEQEDKFHHDTAELQRPAPAIETHEEKDGSDSDGSFVDHGEDSQHLPPQSTEAAFKLSTEDVAEQTAEKLVSEVFSPLDRTLKESEQYRESIESLNRRSPVESKKSVEDLQSEAFENVTKISFGHADEAEDKHDDDHDEEWKVYDRHGEILEEFSTQLTDDVIQEAEGDATTQIMTMTQAEYSPRRSKFLKQESCQEISNEPEVDYYSDLQEKLNILAGEKNNLQALIEEEPSSSASDQLDVIHESDQEAHLEQEHQQEAAAQKEQEEKEEAAEYTATVLVDEVLQQVVHEIIEEEDDQKTMTSDAYLTATEKDDQEYDTCVTSQDDTYESAQGWTSQDSEYTTATSQAPSRLSDSDGEHTARDLERQETSTPQAMISPVDSDRQFTAQQDFEMPVIKAFDPDDFMQTTARSTPDVALQVTIEEEDESDDKLPISPSGILLPPKHDPGRPISPVPPRKTDTNMQKEGDHFVFVREEDTIAEPTPPPQQFHPETEEIRRTPDDTLSTTEITTEPVPQSEEEMEMRRQETERIHSLAMEASSDLGNSESSRYSRQLSDLSSSAESHADTVIRVESERSGSSDSLEVVSVISAGKDSAKMSEKSLTPEDVEKSPIEEKAEDVKEEEHHEENPDQEAEDLGFEVYDADTEEQQQQQQPIEELETVEEEPEDSDSLNEGGNHSSGHSSVGVPADTLAMIGKYRHQSSDNLSLTSLQEFERLEREVGARGDGSLTRSEIELLVAGRLNKSGEGSVSSLAEFERLEKEMTENQSPPEDVMMLSDIREESEAEDMSTRGDDEEDIGGSDTELKSRPVQDEDLRVVTPIAPSPTDSLEHALDPVQMHYLETSTDSLEPTFQEIEVEQRPDSVEDTSLTEYEMVPRVMEASTTDSLDGTATIEKDSVLEGASQGIESTQSTHGLLSGDTLGTVVTDDDRDSLDGEVSSMLQSYPTTLTTFQTTVVGPDGSLQTISRRVETRVTDPLVSHVTFTGTESQERLDQLPDDEQFETVDTEGNVTRTTFHREHDQQHPHF